jgi:E3 ubiquitin-protein ligase HERC2
VLTHLMRVLLRLGWLLHHHQDGKLGQGDNENHFAPVLVQALEGKGITSIACGYDFAAAINVDGHLFTCTLCPPTPILAPILAHLIVLFKGGNGLGGRLGHGDEENRMMPTLVEALIDVPIKAIACGAGHMAATSGTYAPFNVCVSDQRRGWF